MSDFKLLAIRPLKGCDEKYRKNLKEGVIYQFYNDYEFITKDDHVHSEVVDIKYKSSIPENLYNFKIATGKNIHINISAIVGKNGSGKSSLIELLFLAVYVISTKEGKLKPNITSINEKISELKKDEINNHEDEIKYYENQLAEINIINDNLKIDIYYEMNSNLYCININKGAVKQSIENGSIGIQRKYQIKYLFDDNTFEFSDFFYSIAVNYSIYGLNSNHLGHWVDSLFHKNDSYQTPVVINPYRDYGCININVENHLAQSRLLSNLVNKTVSLKYIIENKEIESICFKVDKEKIKEFNKFELNGVIKNQLRYESEVKQNEIKNNNELFSKIYEAILGQKLELEKAVKEVPHFDSIVLYTIKKLYRIAHNYTEYKDKFFEWDTKTPTPPRILDLDIFLIELKKDHSHITLKLKQILNTVRFNLLHNTDTFNWEGDKIMLSIGELKSRINKLNVDNIIEVVPAAFFNPQIEIKGKSNFYSLSSGELQFIQSIQSILYHIVNVNSVFKSHIIKHKYSDINIILDEIELYFHPEFQRIFVSELLNALKQLNTDNILAINILFSTHSPFILSDIPATNILRLKEGNPNALNDQTFGANIHDLLANDFFMEDGFMGAFAKEKIQSLIVFLQDEPNLTMDCWDEIKARKFIDIIGEPLIQSSLNELFYLKFMDNNEKIDTEINRLISLKKKTI